MKPIVLNYGGGRQTVAMCVLIERGILPMPDLILMADTGRENPSTWAYLARYVQPMLAELGTKVTVIPCETLPSLTYGVDEKPMIPVFAIGEDGADAKFSPFCSGTWKRDRMTAWLTVNKVQKGERWIGFSFNEQRRIRRFRRDDGWDYRFPLNELLIDDETCRQIVSGRRWPPVPISSCYMCPHKRNEEWRDIRDNYPRLWSDACDLDRELREQDLFRGGNGVWLHFSRVPLSEADLTVIEGPKMVRQCNLGTCFI